MSDLVPQSQLTRKDFVSNQDVRWCPGCGDYAILNTVQKFLPTLGIPKERIVWVSGIGCSSRFPYYLETYGFHTIHGRAPAIATGLRAANPELSLWLVTGDGDGLSIGGNHLLHCLRRNVDLRILMFNNRIYGLTKGQYSPTSEQGKITKSSPQGTADHPVDPATFALGCGGTFVARSIDVAAAHLTSVLERAAAHRGTAFVEIFQNCSVFNDGAFDSFTDKSLAAERQLHVQHGAPLRYGKNGELGVRLNPRILALEVIRPGQDGTTDADVLIHDETNQTIAHLLTHMPFAEFPVALGVLYAVERPTYDQGIAQQLETANGPRDLDQLLRGTSPWTVL